MSPMAVVTPSEPLADAGDYGPDGTELGSEQSVKYLARADVRSYMVRLPAPAPRQLRVSLELGQEENGVWARVPELDVSAEGEGVAEAFGNVIAATRAWLAYLQEAQPELGPEIAGQARYLPLLEAPVFSWFKHFRFVD
jgi:hypothetical protein